MPHLNRTRKRRITTTAPHLDRTRKPRISRYVGGTVTLPALRSATFPTPPARPSLPAVSQPAS